MDLVATSASLTYNASSRFTLEVHYCNPETGASAWDGMDVTVTEEDVSCDAM
jgi:hypothetical protein